MTAPQVFSEAALTAADRAFTRLYSRHQETVLKVVKKLISREDNFDDCEQLVWVDVLNALRTGRSPLPGHEVGWLGVIARQVTLDERRKINRCNSQEISATSSALEGETDSDYLDRLFYQADGYEADGTRTMATPLTDGLKQLGPRARQVMELRFIAALTSEETGNALGITKASVDVSVSRSLRILRRDVKKVGA